MSEDVTMEWLMEDAIQSGAGLSLAKMTVPVGVTSELHHHSNCSETIHLLSGNIKQRIGESWQELNAGDTCLIPLGNKHQTQNTGTEIAVMMIAYSSGKRVYLKDE